MQHHALTQQLLSKIVVRFSSAPTFINKARRGAFPRCRVACVGHYLFMNLGYTSLMNRLLSLDCRIRFQMAYLCERSEQCEVTCKQGIELATLAMF